MTVYESVLDAIGHTPLIRLSHFDEPIAARVYAKVEFLSIGGSVKDRAALSMIEHAEREGLIGPGGTIVEATSGNTGIGLAIVGRQRGYRVVVGVSDRVTAEKVDLLKAYGAEVIVGSSAVPKQHPSHVFNLVRGFVENTPGAWLANQYDNPANPAAHLATTGPEIWEQTGGRITHFVAGVGTGGTISGAGRFLKEQSRGAVTVVGADPESSTYSGGDGGPYFVESIGHLVHPETIDDAWPESFDPAVLDRFERISDRESLLTARWLAQAEGLLAGTSSGTAVAAAIRVARDLDREAVVVVVLPDSGRSYLSRVFNDTWMEQWGFLDGTADASPSIRSVLAQRTNWRERLVCVSSRWSIGEALTALERCDAPKSVPVVLERTNRSQGIAASDVLGTFARGQIAESIAAGEFEVADSVLSALDKSLPTVGIGQSVTVALNLLRGGEGSLLVLENGRAVSLVERSDLERLVP